MSSAVITSDDKNAFGEFGQPVFGLTSVRTIHISAPAVKPRSGDSSGMQKKRPPNKTFTPIGHVLESILEQCRSESSGGIQHLIHVWEKTVGPPIADNAQPFAVKGSLLLVHVSSSVWMHQLRFLKTELLEKLNQGLGNQRIADIKFKIGPL
jgi:predicted nucleic acid-binding Zn ribbon protein